jgi:sugar-specific transcriptional regulator TrmB
MEEITNLLIELGLTQKQANVLIALSRSECPSVKEISVDVNVHRQEVYQILLELQEIGLVEKFIGVPNRYKTGPISETLNILLERKNKWMSEVQKKAEGLMSNNISKTSERKKEFDFNLITGIERFGNALQNWFENANTIDEILVCDSFAFQIAAPLKVYETKFKDNVKYRMITSASPKDLETFGFMVNAKDVSLRFSSFPTPVDIAIFDGNRAHLCIFSNRQSPMKNEIAALSSNHPCFVQMMQNYFDLLWQISKPSKKLFTNIS